MTILHIDSAAAEDGRIVVVTSPKITDEVFASFITMKNCEPHFKETKCELVDGAIELATPFHDAFGKFLKTGLKKACESVEEYRSAQKLKEQERRRRNLSSVKFSALRLDIPVQPSGKPTQVSESK